MVTGVTQPNWYPDPANSNRLRYWDGGAWTGERVWDGSAWVETPPGAPSVSGTGQPFPAHAGADGGTRRGGARRTWLIAGGAAVLAVVLLVVVISVASGGKGGGNTAQGGQSSFCSTYEQDSTAVSTAVTAYNRIDMSSGSGDAANQADVAQVKAGVAPARAIQASAPSDAKAEMTVVVNGLNAIATTGQDPGAGDPVDSWAEVIGQEAADC